MIKISYVFLKHILLGNFGCRDLQVFSALPLQSGKTPFHLICQLSTFCQFRPKSAKVGEMGPKLKADLAELAAYSKNDVGQSIRQPTPQPTTEEERLRFQYRHNYPYRRQDGRRQMLKGDFGVRDEKRTRPTITSTTTSTPPPTSPPSSTAAPLNAAGPFVTVDHELESENSRQAKDYDYGSDSRLNEVSPHNSFTEKLCTFVHYHFHKRSECFHQKNFDISWRRLMALQKAR